MRRRNLVRAAGIGGVVASGAYVVGDVLMLGRKPEPDRHPALAEIEGLDRTALWMVSSSTNRLAAGALAGHYATPLHLGAVWHLYQGLAPAGPRRALPPVLILASAWTWASFIHGSYFHSGEVYKDLEAVPEEDTATRERLLATAKSFERAMLLAYAPLGLAFVTASVFIIDAVTRGETAYPRWSGPLVAPLLPIAVATALTASHILPGRARHAFQGAGISLGNLISLAASTMLLWRDPKTT